MAIVVRGLGLPDDGSIVVGGFGVSEADVNAMSATLGGSSALTATLTATDGTPPTPPLFANGGGSTGALLLRRKNMSARLSGRSSLRADLTFTANFDDSDIELLLLLELV